MTTATHTLERKLDKEITAFFSKIDASDIPVAVSKQITFPGFLTNKMLIIAAIKTGIPYSLFDVVKDFTPFSENDWARFLGISTKSLQRYKATRKHQFKPIHSEKIIEMAEVTTLGLDVFGNMDKFSLWLNTPSYALGQLKPIELLNDSYGKEMVISELTRIDHGILV